MVSCAALALRAYLPGRKRCARAYRASSSCRRQHPARGEGGEDGVSSGVESAGAGGATTGRSEGRTSRRRCWHPAEGRSTWRAGRRASGRWRGEPKVGASAAETSAGGRTGGALALASLGLAGALSVLTDYTFPVYPQRKVQPSESWCGRRAPPREGDAREPLSLDRTHPPARAADAMMQPCVCSSSRPPRSSAQLTQPLPALQQRPPAPPPPLVRPGNDDRLAPAAARPPRLHPRGWQRSLARVLRQHLQRLALRRGPSPPPRLPTTNLHR